MKLLAKMILVPFVLFISCGKEISEPDRALTPTALFAYELEDVFNVIELTPGEGVALITYTDRSEFYNFMLVKNDGELLWTSRFRVRVNPGSALVQFIQVIAMPDGTFGALYQKGLYIIDLDGSISPQPQAVFNELGFNSQDHIRVLDDGTFLIAGQVFLGGNRGFIAAFTANGTMLYRHLLTINVGGTTHYTSSTPLPDGSFLFAGTFTSNVPSLDNSFFISKLTAQGNLLWTKIHPFSPFETAPLNISQFLTVQGRDLLPLRDGSFVYLLNPRGPELADQRMRLVYVNDEGDEILPHSFINHAAINTTNFSLGARRAAMVLNSDGSITGLGTTAYPIALGNVFLTAPLSYSEPQRSFYFNLDGNGQPQFTDDIDRNYSNAFTAIAKLSDGRTMIAGTQLALGIDLQIITLIL